MTRGRRWLLALSAVVLATTAVAVLLPCVEMRVLIINGTGEVADVTLSLQGRKVWSGAVAGGQSVEILDPFGGQGEFTLEGRLRPGGHRFWLQSTYVTNHLTWKKVFLITPDALETASLKDPLSDWTPAHTLIHLLSCLDWAVVHLIGLILGTRSGGRY